MSTQSPWAGFSADPRGRAARKLRASDRDRDHAAGILANAYAEGRLRSEEHSERLDAALASDHLGDLVPIISDLVVPEPSTPSVRPSRFRRKGEAPHGAAGWRRKTVATRAGARPPLVDRTLLTVGIPLVAVAMLALMVLGFLPGWFVFTIPLLGLLVPLGRPRSRTSGHGGTNQLPNPNADHPNHF